MPADGLAVTTQANSGANQTDQLGVDEPIVMLRGWGAVHHAAHDRAKTAVGINIVTTVARVEGSRLWVTSTGGDNSGWIDSREVLPLTQAFLILTLSLRITLSTGMLTCGEQKPNMLSTSAMSRRLTTRERSNCIQGRHFFIYDVDVTTTRSSFVKTNCAILKPRFDSLRTLQSRITI